MKRIFWALIFCGMCIGAQSQYTFHCVGKYVTGAECDICTGTTTARLFNGLIVKQGATVRYWLDCPLLVKQQGGNLVFQELIYPNPQTVTINLLSTGYADITEFRDSVACPCMMQDTSSSGGGGDPSITNEGILGVAAGGSNDALLTSNTSTANGVTYSGSTTILVTETTSANGGTILFRADTSVLATVTDAITNLSYTGASSPVTLNSSTGTDVTITAGTSIGLTATGTNLTITNTDPDQSTTNELQTIANTSDATSHTATLSNSGGSLQLVEGTGIGIATTGTGLDGIATLTNTLPDQVVSITGAGISVVTGTYPNFTVTSTEVDGSITNEGSLTVGAGGANTSTIVSNTSASTPVTVSGSNTILVTESGSTITVQGDTSLLATVNDINVARNRDDSTFVKTSGSYANKRISDNVYRAGTTGFRTTDTTAVVNAKTISSTKTGLQIEGSTGTGIMFQRAKASGYTGLSNFGTFNLNGQVFAGVNEPYSSRPNYVWNFGYNWDTNATNDVDNEQSVGFGFETYYQNASLSSGSTGFSEFHIRTRDTFGVEHRFFSAVEPWDAQRNKAQLTFTTDFLTLRDHAGSSVWQHSPITNNWIFTDTTNFRFDEPRGFGLTVLNGASSAYMHVLTFNNADQIEIGRSNTDGVRITPPTAIGGSFTPVSKLDVEGNMSIGASYSGTTAAPTNGAIIQGDVGIGNSAPSQPLHVTGNARITGAIYDSNNDPGGSGEVLSSTVTGTDWIAGGGGLSGSGANTQIAYWTGASTLAGSNNFVWDGTTHTTTGRGNYLFGGSFSTSQTMFSGSGTITSTANSLTQRGMFFQPVFANDGTTTGQTYQAGSFSASTVTPTAATQSVGLNAANTNTSANVSQLYGINGTVTENSTTGNLTNRYGLDFNVVKGAQDATAAHTATGIRVRLTETTSTGQWATGIGAAVSVEDAASATGMTIAVNNTVGTNSTQFGQTITNTASNSGVTVANAYGTRYIPTESSSGSITNYYSIINNTTPVATTSYFLYNPADYRNYLLGNLAMGVDVTTAKLFVRGTGSTSSTIAFQLENQAGTDYLVAKDDGKVGIGNNSTLARELHVTGEVRITDVATDTPTKILGVDGDGDVDTVGIAAENELYFSGGSLGTNFHTTIAPATLTAVTNNWNPTGLSTAWIIELSGNGTFVLLTGITAPTFNKTLTLYNSGTNSICLPKEFTTSTAGNRFNFELILFPGKQVEIRYSLSAARWTLKSKAGLYEDVQELYSEHIFRAPVSTTTADYDFWAVNSEAAASLVAPAAGIMSGVSVNTGTSASGNGDVSSKTVFFQTDNTSGTVTYAYCKAVVKTPASLSDGTNDYMLRVGFNVQTAGAGASDGIYFDYNHNNVSGNWGCNTTNGGNTQRNNSGIAVTTSTVYTLEVIVRPSLLVEYFINGTRVATNDSFVSTGDDMLCLAEIEKSIGTAQRDFEIFTLQTNVALVDRP